MLAWLKTILGDTYSDDVDKKVSDEIGKGFVARTDFNVLNDAKKQLDIDIAARDKQIEELKKVDPSQMQAEIDKLQKQNADDKVAYEAKLQQARIDAAVNTALLSSKAKNVKTAKALLDLTGAELLADGTVKGLAEQVQKLQADKETSFMFETAKPPKFQTLKPGESGDNLPGTAKPSTLADAVRAHFESES